MKSKVTYRQQYTRCGKQRCRKCREGEGHGPYWYAYWSEKGRTVSIYHEEQSHLSPAVHALRETALPQVPRGRRAWAVLVRVLERKRAYGQQIHWLASARRTSTANAE